MYKIIAIAALAATSMPAAAVTQVSGTWSFGGTAGNVGSVTANVAGVTVTVEARRFSLPAASNGELNLTNLSQLVTGSGLLVRRTAAGVGITQTGQTGGVADQLDTNTATAREAFLVTAARPLRLTGARISYVDNNDTLRIYGVRADGSLQLIGFDGLLASGLAGAATTTFTTANNGTSSMTFNNPFLPAFTRYVFTTRGAGNVTFPQGGGDLGQGYRLDRIVGATVPEPATWGMMILGFGLVGTALRRRPVSRVLA